VLDAIRVGEAEIAREICAHSVGVEHNCIEERRERGCERGFTRSRQTHDENLAHRVALLGAAQKVR